MTLGGIIFIRNGEQYDYCYKEAIACLQELCDKVIILDAGSDDGTSEIVQRYEDQNTMVVCLWEEEWKKRNGREKLAYFQNLALSFLDTDYYFLLQGDEIVHQDSFDLIRKAVETGKEAFYCTRINLWRDCYSYINVAAQKQPCSTEVIRLARIKYKSVGDGESIEAIADPSFVNEIVIFHYGFVRKRDIMKAKIINMQEGVFQIPHDPKLDNSEIFDWRLWFNENELSPTTKEHPKFIQNWIKTRP